MKVTTHVGSDCVLDCSLARGTEFGTVTIISMLQHFFYFRFILFSTNYLVSFEGGNVELGEHGEYHVMTTL